MSKLTSDSNGDVQVSRREFITTTAALALAAQWSPMSRARAAEAVTADQVIPGKSDQLLVHNAKIGEIETPIELLRKHPITPKDLLFIRNNQVLPGSMSLAPAKPEGWLIDLIGLINAPAQVSATDLLKMESVEHEAVLQCSGSGRTRFYKTAKVDGVPWGQGAMGNVHLRGVALSALLERLKVQVQPEAKYVVVEGRDVPDKPGAEDFEHSLPLNDALSRTLLVTHLNGEPLPLAHGGPVRAVTLGYYATMNVKWLSRLRFESQETANYNHVGRYRTPLKPIAPGSAFKSTLANSEPNWNMKIKSVIFSPLAGEKITGGRTITVSGVAWNDGVTKLASVEVTADEGQTWHRAELTFPSSPYAWHQWKATVPVAKGACIVRSRATDVLGLSQPFDGGIHWNPAGYAWNGADEIAFEVT